MKIRKGFTSTCCHKRRLECARNCTGCKDYKAHYVVSRPDMLKLLRVVNEARRIITLGDNALTKAINELEGK